MKVIAPNQISRFKSTKPYGFDAYFRLSLMLIICCFMFFLNIKDNIVIISVRNTIADNVRHFMIMGSYPLLSIKNIQDELRSLAAAKSENVALLARVNELKKWEHYARVLSIENKSLQEKIRYVDNSSKVFLSARINKVIDSTGSIRLMLSAGREAGLIKHMTVIVNGYIVGRIIEVGEKTSVIMPINDPMSKIPVFMETSLKHAIISGAGGDKFLLNHQQENMQLVNGELLISSGEGGMYPRGIAVAVIRKKEGHEAQILSLFSLTDSSIAQVLEPIDSASEEEMNHEGYIKSQALNKNAKNK
jgi:rod shape-determining protein MreC